MQRVTPKGGKFDVIARSATYLARSKRQEQRRELCKAAGTSGSTSLTRSADNLEQACRHLLTEGVVTESEIRALGHKLIEIHPDILTFEQLSPKTILYKVADQTETTLEEFGILKDPTLWEMVKESGQFNQEKEVQDLLQRSTTLLHSSRDIDQPSQSRRRASSLIADQTIQLLVTSYQNKKEIESQKHKNLVELARKIQALINPAASLPEDRKSQLQAKLSALEEHLNKAKQQVDVYKSNCGLLADLIVKQPQLVTREALLRLAKFGAVSSRSARLTADQVGQFRDLDHYKKCLDSAIIGPLSEGGEVGPDSALQNKGLNTRSVIHSYLSRSPTIARHIGCAGNDLARLLRLVS